MPIHVAHRDRRAVLQQRIELRELDDGIRHLRIAARGVQAHFGPVHEPEAAFPDAPAEVRAFGYGRHLFGNPLADVGHVHRAGLRVPRESLRIARAVRVDLAERVRIVVVHERVVLRNAVLAVRAVVAERIDAENLAERAGEILRDVLRIAAAAAIGIPEIQQTVVGASAPRGRIEAELSAVVIHVRTLPPHQLARGVAIVSRGRRILRGPLEEHRMMRHLRARRMQPVRRRRDVRWCRCRCRSFRSPRDPRRLKSGWNAKLWNPRSKFWNCTWMFHRGSWWSKYGVTVFPSLLTV